MKQTESMHYDYLNHKLNIGDRVVFITPNYRDFSIGIIKKFTKVYVFIETDKKYNNEIKQTANQLIKIP